MIVIVSVPKYCFIDLKHDLEPLKCGILDLVKKTVNFFCLIQKTDLYSPLK